MAPKRTRPKKEPSDITPKGQRRYTDQDRADALAALAANNGSIQRTARELDMPESTLEAWANGAVHPSIPKIRDQTIASMADRAEDLGHMLIGDMAMPAARERASFKDLAIAFAIVVDKMRLLREQPTSIQQKGEMTDEQLLGRLRSLSERVRRRIAADDGRGEGRVGDTGGNSGTASPPG